MSKPNTNPQPNIGSPSGKRSFHLDHLNTKYEILTPQLILIERNPTYKTPQNFTEVFGSPWVLMAGTLKRSQAQFVDGHGRTHELPGGDFLGYFPAHSVVQWQLAPGELSINMIASTHATPNNWSRFPVFWLNKYNHPILTAYQRLLENGPPKDVMNISRFDESCGLSHRAKKYLVENYHQPISMTKLAYSLKTAPAVLTRYFKKSTGMTPLKFLNQMRVMDSIHHIHLNEKNILETSEEMGFTFPRQYYHNFVKTMGVGPSSLL